MRTASAFFCLLGLLATACSDAPAPEPPAPPTPGPAAAPAAPPAPAPEASAEADRLEQSGLKAIRHGNFEKGFRELDAAVELTPEVARLRFARGKAYAMVGRIPDAQIDLDKAVELDADNAEYVHERARVLALVGDIDGTLAALHRAAELDPETYPLDVTIWRKAVHTWRAANGTQEARLDLIRAELALLRGLAFLKDVPSERQSIESFGEMVNKSLDEELGSSGAADMEAGLTRLGLLEESVDLKRDVSNALMSQAAAYYDPEQEKFFFLIENASADFMEAVGAHELVHALQDQHYDLDGYMKRAERREGEPRNDDRVFAMRCVVEGEAMFVQMGWQAQQMSGQGPEAALGFAANVVGMVSNMRAEQLADLMKSVTNALPPDSPIRKAALAVESIPPYIVVPLMGAYMDGANMIARVHKAGGWNAVAQLYEKPPATAEQCLHARAFVDGRDEPTPIGLPALPEIGEAGFEEIDAAVHGEMYLRILLTQQNVSEDQARTATGGWDGDLYRAYRDPTGRVGLVLATTWDTEGDAREFYDAYRTALAAKYPRLTPEGGVEGEVLTYTCGGDLGSGSLRRRGREVFSVEGFSREVCTKTINRLAEHEVAHVD